jgi:hypothetical protein
MRKLTLEMFNVEANRGNRNCFSIILIFEEANDGRLSRVVQSDDEDADLLVSPIFGENFEETSTEHHRFSASFVQIFVYSFEDLRLEHFEMNSKPFLNVYSELPVSVSFQ